MTAETTIRDATDAEVQRVARSLRIAPDEGLVFRVAECEAEVVAVGMLDPRGSATEPDDPALRVVTWPEAEPDVHRDLLPLVASLIAAAEGTGARRLVIGWDPMDAQGLKGLERLGFKVTGTWPYRVLGADHVEHVSGYQDATGSTVDLALDLGS